MITKKHAAKAEEVLEVLAVIAAAADAALTPPTLSDEAQEALDFARQVVGTAEKLGGLLGVEVLETVAGVLERVPLEQLVKLLAKLRRVEVTIKRGTLTIGDGVRVRIAEGD